MHWLWTSKYWDLFFPLRSMDKVGSSQFRYTLDLEQFGLRKNTWEFGEYLSERTTNTWTRNWRQNEDSRGKISDFESQSGNSEVGQSRGGLRRQKSRSLWLKEDDWNMPLFSIQPPLKYKNSVNSKVLACEVRSTQASCVAFLPRNQIHEGQSFICLVKHFLQLPRIGSYSSFSSPIHTYQVSIAFHH